MDDSAQSTVTRLLSDLQEGRAGVVNELFSLVYETLRELARDQRRSWQGDFTINTTALVHEAYLKLVGQNRPELETRAHFMNVAAKVMRHVLVDHARARGARKRGGEVQKISIDEELLALPSEMVLTDDRADELLALDEALKRLAEVSEREARVVECRFFGGMSIQETASALGISAMTVKRDWALALAWLRRDLEPTRD